jgi:hypothetical protein
MDSTKNNFTFVIYMDIDNLYKLKSRFAAKATGEELVIVPLCGHVSKMNRLFTLNETARFIWEKLDRDATTESIAKALAEEFEIDFETAKADVHDFLQKLTTYFNEITFEK